MKLFLPTSFVLCLLQVLNNDVTAFAFLAGIEFRVEWLYFLGAVLRWYPIEPLVTPLLDLVLIGEAACVVW